jgi:hypothetical protein
VSTAGDLKGKICFSTAIMAKGGVGPCGSFCDTGSFSANIINCQVPKCPLQNKNAYKLIKPEVASSSESTRKVTKAMGKKYCGNYSGY